MQTNAVFDANITTTPCTINNSTYRVSSPKSQDDQGEYKTPDMNQLLMNLLIPKEKVFDITKFIPQTVTKIQAVNKLSLYPNRAKNNFRLEFFSQDLQEDVSVHIYDVSGKLVYSREFSNVYFINEQLKLPFLTTGIYNVVVITSKGTDSRKLVIAQ